MTAAKIAHTAPMVRVRPVGDVIHEAATDQTRERIVTAARELLSDPGGIAAFTIDAVAKQAGVARMTVYYQFGSKPALLEALYDDLGARGGLHQLRDVFQQSDSLAALDSFIAAFVRFFSTNRLVLRRLEALSALDPEVDRSLTTRGGWRREGLRVLLERIAAQSGRPAEEAVLAEQVDILHTLTSVATYDALASDARTPDDVTAIIRRLARSVIRETPS